MDDIISRYVATDVRDRDPDGAIIPGSYSQLQGKEWGGCLQHGDVLDWVAAMRNHVPKLSCGRLKVCLGSHGRGWSNAHYPRPGPFLT